MKGTVHHHFLIIAAVVAIWTLVLYLLVARGIIKNPFVAAPSEPKIQLKTEYKNPFDKKTQYVNPFDQFKSPLLNLK